MSLASSVRQGSPLNHMQAPDADAETHKCRLQAFGLSGLLEWPEKAAPPKPLHIQEQQDPRRRRFRSLAAHLSQLADGTGQVGEGGIMEGACDAAGVLQANHLHCAAVGQGRHQRSEVGLQGKQIGVAAAVLWRAQKQMLGFVLPSGTRAAALREKVSEGEKRFGAEAQGWQACMAHAFTLRHGAGCLNALATEPAREGKWLSALLLKRVVSMSSTLKSLHMLQEEHVLSAMPSQSEGPTTTAHTIRGLSSRDAAMTYLHTGVVVQLEVLQAAELAEGGEGEVAVERKTAHVYPQQVACRDRRQHDSQQVGTSQQIHRERPHNFLFHMMPSTS